jgi:hypothetical protein
VEFSKEGVMNKEYQAFTEALEKVLSVSHAEIKKREDEEKARKSLAPRKRKVKPKPFALGPASPGKG